MEKWSCLYNKSEGMRVTSTEEEYKQLRESGEWFDHPNEVKDKEVDNEKQIRRVTRKRRSDGECSSKEI